MIRLSITEDLKRSRLLGLLEMMEKNYIGWATVFAATVLNQPDRPEVKEEP